MEHKQSFYLPNDIWHEVIGFLSNKQIYNKTLTLCKPLHKISWKLLDKTQGENYAIRWACEHGHNGKSSVVTQVPSPTHIITQNL